MYSKFWEVIRKFPFCLGACSLIITRVNFSNVLKSNLYETRNSIFILYVQKHISRPLNARVSCYIIKRHDLLNSNVYILEHFIKVRKHRSQEERCRAAQKLKELNLPCEILVDTMLYQKDFTPLKKAR